ncbi:MAG: hypothetical protein ACKOYC_10650, partial [Bacteroidota bacterium]
MFKSSSRIKSLVFSLASPLFALSFFGCGSSSSENPEKTTLLDSIPIDTLRKPVEIKRTKVVELSQETISEYAKTNACYLPLLKDSTLYEQGRQIGFSYDELFNSKLPIDNPYRNRYLVGDFNVLNRDS